MANRIKGITVEIGGDTTKLSKALEGVNKNIRNIISKEDFEKIQLIIQKHIEERNIVKDIGKYQKKYSFSGKIICGECGSKFKRQTQSVGIAWACITHLEHKEQCSMKFIKDAAIKAAFVTMLNKLIFGCKWSFSSSQV